MRETALRGARLHATMNGMEYVVIDMLREVTTHLWMAGQDIQPRINREAAIEKLKLATDILIRSTATIV